VVAVALAIGLVPARALAERIVVGDLYAEPDLRDHAAATTMLVRSMLGSANGSVASGDEVATALAKISGGAVGTIAWIPPSDGPALLRVLGANALVVGSVTRDGPRLTAAIQILDATGSLIAARVASAPGDDVRALAKDLAKSIGASTGLSPVDAASTSVGQLRPYAAALRALAHDDLATATAWLATADPRVAGRVADARTAGRVARERTDLPVSARLDGALLALDPAALTKLAGDRKVRRQPEAAAAIARSHLGALDTDAARQALRKARGRADALVVARAALAHRAGDSAGRNEAVADLLGDEPSLRALAFVASLPSKALSADLEGTAFAAAETLPAEHRRLRSTLALRAARGGISVEKALTHIDVAELDSRERKQLAKVLSGEAASSPQGLRLRSELDVSRGKLKEALALSEKAIAAAADDARVWATHGRLMTAAGNPDAAIEALRRATNLDPWFTRELARALLEDGQYEAARRLLEGLPDASSVELARARGLAMLEGGDADQAVAALRQATLLDPSDLAAKEALARAFDASGRTATAAELREATSTLRAKGLTVRESALIDEPEGAQRAALADDQLQELADNELRDLLEAFPLLVDGGIRAAAVVPIAVKEPFYRPRHALPDRLEQSLRLALTRHYKVRIREAEVGATIAEPLVRQRLGAIAADARAPALIGYRIEADGGNAAIKLVLYDAKSEEASEVAGAVTHDRYGLVRWNTAFVVGVATILALLLFWQALVFLRGTGTLQVKVVLDPGARREVFNLVITRRAKRPEIGPHSDFIDRTRQQGHQETRYGATLVGPTTSFDRLPPGRWFVHLVGVYEKGNEQRELGPAEATREVRVRRNQTERVELDLVPVTAEYAISVYDGTAPAPGASVWLDSNADAAKKAPASGELLFHIPVGEHILNVKANGVTVKKTLNVADTRVHRLVVNLERERRLAEVAGGIELGGMSSGTSGKEASVQMRHITSEELEEKAALAAVGTSATVGLGAGGAPLAAPTGGPPPVTAAAIGTSPGAGVANRGAVGSSPGLDRYRRTSELGRGAMGVVYRAHDTVLERDVALKLMSDEIRQHPQAMKLFLREAKALAQLNHPNIVTVFDQGEDAEGAFMVMELVEGDTVEHLLEQGDGIPMGKALEIIDQCAAGLAYAHGRRVIHRDIKPGNMFMSQDGIVKLGDFGLARVVEEISIRKTEVRGTPLYMAPEQITGTDVDFRADLYALGCTAFELLSGRPPFIDGQILYHHMHTAPPSLRSLVPEVPPELEAVVARCIAKNKADRPASANDLRKELRPLCQRLCS